MGAFDPTATTSTTATRARLIAFGNRPAVLGAFFGLRTRCSATSTPSRLERRRPLLWFVVIADAVGYLYARVFSRVGNYAPAGGPVRSPAIGGLLVGLGSSPIPQDPEQRLSGWARRSGTLLSIPLWIVTDRQDPRDVNAVDRHRRSGGLRRR